MNTVLNTKKKGTFYYLFLKEDDDYVGICLNLNIIEYGKDLDELQKSLREAAFSHLEAVRKHNLSDEYLNIPAPQEYWDMFFDGAGNIEIMEKVLRKPSKTTAKVTLDEIQFFALTQQSYLNSLRS